MAPRQQTTQSCLLSLPAELRLRIYAYLFADVPQARTLYVFGDRLYRWRPSKPRRTPKCAILYVCRLLYIEALPAYVESTHFAITCWGPAPNFKNRFKELGTLYDFPLTRIRKLTLTLESTSDEDVGSIMSSVREMMHILKHARAVEALTIDITVAPDHMSVYRIDNLFHFLGRTIQCAGEVRIDLHSWGRGRPLPEYRLFKSMCEDLNPYVLPLLREPIVAMISFADD